MKLNKKKLDQAWLSFVRKLFRSCGGYHRTEHAELIWAAEVRAEVEAAELRLYKNHMEMRHKMLSRMLNEELRAKAVRESKL